MAVLNNAVTSGLILRRTVAVNPNMPVATRSITRTPTATWTMLAVAVKPAPVPSPNGGLIILTTTGGTRS